MVDISNLLDKAKAWHNCELCNISCRKKAFARGDDLMPIKYLFIGDAPSASDSVVGSPLVDQVGMLFNQLIQESGVTHWRVTNVLACYPYKEGDKSKFRKPSKLEILNCKPRLDLQVEMLEPQYYIALGKTAKLNPPTGVTYHLELDHPIQIAMQSENKRKVAFQRNKNKLRNFVRENG